MTTKLAKILPSAYLHDSTIAFSEGRIIIKSCGHELSGTPIKGDAIFFTQSNGYMKSATLYMTDNIPIHLNEDHIELPSETSHVAMQSYILNDTMYVEIKLYIDPRDDTNEYIYTGTVKCAIHRFDDELKTPFVMEYVVLKYVTALEL